MEYIFLDLKSYILKSHNEMQLCRTSFCSLPFFVDMTVISCYLRTLNLACGPRDNFSTFLHPWTHLIYGVLLSPVRLPDMQGRPTVRFRWVFFLWWIAGGVYYWITLLWLAFTGVIVYGGYLVGYIIKSWLQLENNL